MKNSHPNALQLHLYDSIFVHICIQLYFLVNLFTSSCGFLFNLISFLFVLQLYTMYRQQIMNLLQCMSDDTDESL